MIGKIHSQQSLGASDGPGIRYVVFMQGCNLRCSCCHNPDTWSMSGGTEIGVDEILENALRYKPYFGDDGGITISGGEALLQAKFVRKVFEKCRKKGIHTCLDTAGNIINDEVVKLLKVTDYILLDIKYNTEELYKRYVGCSLSSVLKFLDLISNMEIKTLIRCVIIPNKNDNAEMIKYLCSIKEKYKNIVGIELLPFNNICTTKYEHMGIPFPFKDISLPTAEKMKELRELVAKEINKRGCDEIE